MTTKPSQPKPEGFTLIELLCVIAIIAILAALLLPSISKARANAQRIQCVSQLRQAGIGFQAFAHDHSGKFPMAWLGAIPARAASNAPVSGPEDMLSAVHVFQALAPELGSPRVLTCPADTRLPAAGFAVLTNANLSYFVSLTADPGRPSSILAGDRNLTNDFLAPEIVLRLGPNHYLRWTHELHRFRGNLLFSDGHVEERNSLSLLQPVPESGSTAKFAIPDDARFAAAARIRSAAIAKGAPTPASEKAPTESASVTVTTRVRPPQPTNPLVVNVPGPSPKSNGSSSTALANKTSPPPAVVASGSAVSLSPRVRAARLPLAMGLWLLWLLCLLFLAFLLAVQLRRRFSSDRKRLKKLQS